MTSYYPVTSEITWHNSLLAELLVALSTRPAAALLVDARVRLRTGEKAPTPRNDDPALFTEPTFTGYTEATPTISAPVNLDADGQGVAMTVTFTCSADGSAQQITGWWLSNDVAGDPTRVYAEGDLTDEEIIIQRDGDLLSLTIVLPIRADQVR